jgi:hypothetical protein
MAAAEKTPERAEAGDAGSHDVQRGRSGVPLTQKERWRIVRLIPLYEHEIDNVPLVLERLYKALRGEQRRGRAGHWSYQRGMLNRTRSLLHYIKLYEGVMREEPSASEEYQITKEGDAAFDMGKLLDDCPYSKSSDHKRWRAWMAGYHAAKERDDRKREEELKAAEKRQDAIAKYRGLK